LLKDRKINAVPTSSPDRPDRLAWSAILLLAVVQFAAYVDRSLPAVAAPLIKVQFGLSDTQIGALQGPAFSTLYAVGLLVAGHLIAGRNPYRVAALCAAVWTAGCVIFALAPDYSTMVAGRIVLGLGQAAFAPAALMLLAGQGDPDRRARSLSMLTTGSAVGRSAALLIGGAALAVVAGRTLFGLEPWRIAGLLLVLPNLVVIGLLWRLAGGVGPATSDERPGLGDAFRLIRARRGALIPAMAAGAFSVLAVQACGAWGTSILNRGFGLEAAGAALTVGVVVLVFAPIGHLGAGWILGSRTGRRLGAGPLMAIGMVLAALSSVGLAASATTAGAIAGLAGLTIGAGTAAVAALIEIQAMTEPRLRPQVGAVFLALTSLVGVGMGPLLTGVISDTGPRGTGGLAWALAWVTMASAVVVGGLGLTFAGRWRRAGPALGPIRIGDGVA
jgi:predicted MFS family arabinose efflux permease